jgi:hypothetical protein
MMRVERVKCCSLEKRERERKERRERERERERREKRERREREERRGAFVFSIIIVQPKVTDIKNNC